MSQDIVADNLNQIMNAKRAGKEEVIVRSTKLFIEILKIMKKEGYIEYKEDKNKVKVNIKELNECKAIKPRYYVRTDKIEKYIRRFLPARNVGIIIISTSKGLMTQEEAYKNKLGGSLIAYIF